MNDFPREQRGGGMLRTFRAVRVDQPRVCVSLVSVPCRRHRALHTAGSGAHTFADSPCSAGRGRQQLPTAPHPLAGPSVTSKVQHDAFLDLSTAPRRRRGAWRSFGRRAEATCKESILTWDGRPPTSQCHGRASAAAGGRSAGSRCVGNLPAPSWTSRSPLPRSRGASPSC